MTHSRILAYHLSLILARHASSFIGMQETKYLLDRMEEILNSLLSSTESISSIVCLRILSDTSSLYKHPTFFR